ncbi:MAG: hypothetical protein NG737_05550, partial [Omnitrophica bacterium]|nr:hypothetical protein [Candidatus Omnitrophota bacterium]
MNILFLSILAVVSVFSLGIGVFLIIKPDLAIEIQRIFYEKINWKMEPISMEKEIRNTKIMGLFLIIAVISIVAW